MQAAGQPLVGRSGPSSPYPMPGVYSGGCVMNIVVVESPTVAQAVETLLGSGYRVLASGGYAGDFQANCGPTETGCGAAVIGADRRLAKHALRAIETSLEGAESLVLATSPDREGEAIAWQVLAWLRDADAIGSRPVQRVVFHEITPDGVREAMARPRDIDTHLVDARLGERALDQIVGFHLTPEHLRRIPRDCTAVHAQYAALRLICDREAEIESFTSRESWTFEADFVVPGGSTFTARLSRLDGVPLGEHGLATRTMADRVVERARGSAFRVEAVDHAEVLGTPAPPFTTSTLQQAASRILGFSVRKTMRIARSLYEGFPIDGETVGLITFIRTDAVALAKPALAQVRRILRGSLGERYLSAKVRKFRSRRGSAQQAREAIRPTDIARSPQAVADRIGPDEARLYDLIWRRAVAGQMSPARFDRVRVDLASDSGEIALTASGSTMTFDGFLRIDRERRAGAAHDCAMRRLPELRAGETLTVGDVRAAKLPDLPPRRYTEADLVRKLSELGIGGPSTYDVVVSALQGSEYVTFRGGRFVSLERAREVVAFVETFFQRWVDYDFTAGLERDLDRVASGCAGLNEFLLTFRDNLEATLEQSGATERRDVLAAIDGPCGASGPAEQGQWAEARTRIVLGVGPDPGPALHADRPFKGSSMAAEHWRAQVGA